MRKAEGVLSSLLHSTESLGTRRTPHIHDIHRIHGVFKGGPRESYGSGRREKKPRQAAVVWLPLEEGRGGGGGRQEGNVKLKGSDSVIYYALPFLYGILCPSRSSAGWLSFVLRIASTNVHADTLYSRYTSPFTRKRFAPECGHMKGLRPETKRKGISPPGPSSSLKK